MRSRRSLALAPVLAIVSSLLVVLGPTPAQAANKNAVQSSEGSTATLRQRARVIRVIDGDTVDVRLRSGRQRRVRLIGIDTPEVYGSVECGGRKASRSLKRMLPQGTRVNLVSDPTQSRTDIYGRILRYVIKVESTRDVNRAQIWRGLARIYVYNDNPFKRVVTYRRAQRQAKIADRGIWGSCV